MKRASLFAAWITLAITAIILTSCNDDEPPLTKSTIIVDQSIYDMGNKSSISIPFSIEPASTAVAGLEMTFGGEIVTSTDDEDYIHGILMPEILTITPEGEGEYLAHTAIVFRPKEGSPKDTKPIEPKEGHSYNCSYDVRLKLANAESTPFKITFKKSH